MTSEDVLGLYRSLNAAGVQVWLMGGWGVDALIGRQTREHHDVDLLVELRGLARLRELLEDAGLWNVPYAFTAEGLSGTGSIDGHPVRCLSVELQRQAHTGYELPPHHVRDLELLG